MPETGVFGCFKAQRREIVTLTIFTSKSDPCCTGSFSFSQSLEQFGVSQSDDWFLVACLNLEGNLAEMFETTARRCRRELPMQSLKCEGEMNTPDSIVGLAGVPTT